MAERIRDINDAQPIIEDNDLAENSQKCLDCAKCSQCKCVKCQQPAPTCAPRPSRAESKK